MLSREEWQIMQRQFVSMSDEKNAMLANIRQLTPVKGKLLAAKQILSEKFSATHREENLLLNEMSVLQQKIAQIKSQMNNKNPAPTWDEKRLMKKEAKLKETINSGEKLDQQIEFMKGKKHDFIKKVEKIDKDLEKAMSDVKYMINCYKKIGNMGKANMLLQDKESELEITKNQIKNLKIAKKKKEESIKNAEIAIEDLTSQLLNKEEQSTNIQEQYKELSKVLHTTTETLGLVKYEYEGVKNALDSSMFLLKENKDKDSLIMNPLVKHVEEMRAKRTKNENAIEEMKQEFEQKKIEQGIAIGKKKKLIEQLKKMVQEKISEMTVNFSTSAYVQKLISQQEKHWMERNEVNEEFESVARNHKRRTDDISRKAIVADELRVIIKSIPPPKVKGPLEEFNNVYLAVINENRRLGKKVMSLKEEEAALQKELNLLRENSKK